METKKEGEVVVMGRAEIDTRPPFTSVKQAVLLFGERVLAGEIYATKLKEINEARGESSETGGTHSKIRALTSELEDTKRSLEKAKEEATIMAHRIHSLKDEMERTKKELRETKAREILLLQNRDHEEVPEVVIEDLKFIENNVKARRRNSTQELFQEQEEEEEEKEYFQRKRYVKFASPHALAQVINCGNGGNNNNNRDEQVIKKVKRNKPLMPLIGWLFAKRKSQICSPRQ